MLANEVLVSVTDTTAEPAEPLSDAARGSVTITIYGPVGGTIEGTFAVEGFEQP